MKHGSTVATASVTAGNPLRDHYRLRVARGRYRVEATNWPAVHRKVMVRNDSDVSASFLNVCD
jgi:hypothetical protein